MRVALGALLAFTLVACGSSKKPVFVGSTTTVSTPVAGRGQLTAVRVAKQNGFQRVTFEFSRDLPGYSVGYVNRPIQEDGSGNDVPVGGDNVVEVHMEH